MASSEASHTSRWPSVPTGDAFALQRSLGNHAMSRLLESGGLQAKLLVSQPGDADEQEADRAVEQVVSSQTVPRLQRKCACGGSCPQCQEEEVIHRSARTTPVLGSFPFSIQRQAATTTTTEDTSRRATAAEAGAREDQARHPGERPRTLIVEDDAPSLAPGQMHKTQFLNLLQSRACATADEVLKSVGHTTKRCPYIKKWLEYYKDKDAQYLMRVMHKYVPETARARTAHGAIVLMNERAKRAALIWVKTGKVSEVPEGLPAEMLHGEGLPGGGMKAGAGGSVQKKSRDGGTAGEHDATAVKEQLGSGHSLDHRVQSQMSSAFGYDFSGVRVHTDGKAGELSSRLNARAFTIGSDVAFAGGEYKPGTLIGDALIAHELAHVIQQGGGNRSGGFQTKDAALGNDGSLEQHADRSAVGAVVAAWTGLKKGLADVGANALPRLKSGLRLQRCALAALPEVAALAGGGAAAGEVAIGTGVVTGEVALGTGVVTGEVALGTGAVGTGVVGTGTGVVGTGVLTGEAALGTGAVGTGVVGTGAATGTGVVTTGAATGTGVATGTGLTTTALRVAAIAAATQVSDEPHTQEREKPEERKKPVCATEYPGIPLCDSLPAGYSFESVTQALEALKKALGNPHLSLRSPAPTITGPCPGIGTHIGVKAGGTYVASIVCCPCCIDTPGGPVMSRLCRII